MLSLRIRYLTRSFLPCSPFSERRIIRHVQGGVIFAYFLVDVKTPRAVMGSGRFL